MNKQAQEAIQSEILDIAAKSNNEPLKVNERGMAWGQGEHTLSLPEPVAFSFLGLVGKLARQHPWSERVSEEFIRERLVPILRAAREDGPDAMTKLLDKFSSRS